MQNENVERIVSTARGWPVVLLVLARLALEGRLEAASSEAAGVDFEDLFVYLIHEVLAPLSALERRVLLLCSAVPELTEEELRHILDLPRSQVRQIVHTLPLLGMQESEFSVHPIVRDIVV